MSILEKMCLYLVPLYFLGTLMKLYTKYLAIIKAKKGMPSKRFFAEKGYLFIFFSVVEMNLLK